MKDEQKTKSQLIAELKALRRRVACLESSIAKHEIDITKRKQAEEKLREANQLLVTMFDNSHVLIAYMDSEFNFLKVNRNYAIADEKTPDFFIGKNHFVLFPNEENKAIFRRVVETGKPHYHFAKPFEYASNPERGITYWDWSLIPIKDQNGKVINLVLTLLDVTERVKAYQLLHESENRFKALSEATYEAIFISEKGICIDTNEAASRMFGYTYNEIIGGFGTDFIAPESKLLVKKNMLGGYAKPYDAIALRKDGTKFHAELQGRMFEYKGKKVRITSVRDITERKKTENKLQKYAQTQELLGREVNHRVKNNLAAIIGMLYIEKRYAEKSLKRRMDAAILNNMVNRIKGLSTVHNLLSASEWSPQSLSKLARYLIASALQVLPSDKQVSVDILADAPVAVSPKEAHHLAIVINELAANVVKHVACAKETAQITVRIAPEPDEKTILIEFRDNGPGFSEAVLDSEGRNVGMYLLENTVRHSLRGEITFHNDNGAVVTIQFAKETE